MLKIICGLFVIIIISSVASSNTSMTKEGYAKKLASQVEVDLKIDYSKKCINMSIENKSEVQLIFSETKYEGISLSYLWQLVNKKTGIIEEHSEDWLSLVEKNFNTTTLKPGHKYYGKRYSLSINNDKHLANVEIWLASKSNPGVKFKVKRNFVTN